MPCLCPVPKREAWTSRTHFLPGQFLAVRCFLISFRAIKKKKKKKQIMFSGLSSGSKMEKGTPSFGKHHNNTHTHTHTQCHWCGSKAYHLQKPTHCKCGSPAKQKRKYNWSAKAKRWNATSAGQMRYLKIVYCRFRYGLHEGTTPKPKRKAVAAPSSS